jgi:hypothetical protein
MAMLGNVRYHVLRDYNKQKINVDSQQRQGMSQEMRDNYIAFTCLLAAPEEGVVYCGVTAYNNDILHTFDLQEKVFRTLGYQSVAEPYEVKVHRSLERASDGAIYSASACLHDPSERLKAPGGAVFRLLPGNRRIEKLCIPCKHDYIQTITLDDKRKLVYGFTYPVFKFFVYHIETGEVEDYDYIGSITHISALDDAGRIWGTWHNTQHYLFSYDPDTREINWTRNRLPGAAKDANRMYPGAGPVDVMINGGDGYLYIGSTGGALYRLDPKKGEAEWLGKPSAADRMPGLTVWRDGLLLGVVGDEKTSNVFVYDREKRSFHTLGPIVATGDGKPIYRTHDLAIVGKTLYVAETDVPDRSGYLWECEIDL